MSYKPLSKPCSVEINVEMWQLKILWTGHICMMCVIRHAVNRVTWSGINTKIMESSHINLYIGLLKSLSCLCENYLLEQGPTMMLAENSINILLQQWITIEELLSCSQHLIYLVEFQKCWTLCGCNKFWHITTLAVISVCIEMFAELREVI